MATSKREGLPSHPSSAGSSPIDYPILEAVTERDIDLLLLEEIHASDDFRRWLRERAFGDEGTEIQFINAWHSVSDPVAGETDLLVLFVDPRGHSSALLLEDKVDAPSQPDQARRYKERGDFGMQQGRWQAYRTVIVAPKRYLQGGGDAAEYDAQVSYEDVGAWLGQHGGESDRARYRIAVLRTAIEQNRRGYSPKVDQRVTRFFEEYWECAREEFPELEMERPRRRPAASLWAGFHPRALPKNCRIWHKADIGRVDLELKGAASSVEQLRRRLAPYLAADTQVVAAGKSAAVRIRVPRLDALQPFKDQLDKAREGLRAAYRLRYQAPLLEGLDGERLPT